MHSRPAPSNHFSNLNVLSSAESYADRYSRQAQRGQVDILLRGHPGAGGDRPLPLHDHQAEPRRGLCPHQVPPQRAGACLQPAARHLRERHPPGAGGAAGRGRPGPGRLEGQGPGQPVPGRPAPGRRVRARHRRLGQHRLRGQPGGRLLPRPHGGRALPRVGDIALDEGHPGQGLGEVRPPGAPGGVEGARDDPQPPHRARRHRRSGIGRLAGLLPARERAELERV